MIFSRLAFYLLLNVVLHFCGTYAVFAMDKPTLETPLLSDQKEEDSLEKDLEELSVLADLLIKQGSSTDLVPLYETPLIPLDLTFYNAVLEGQNQQITRCLLTGVSLQTKDAQGKTVFHHLAVKEKEFQAHATLCILISTPRKYVVDTVRAIALQGNLYSRLTKWHIAGLVRVLLMQDDDGNIPLDYIDQDSPDKWHCYFQVDPAYIEKHFGNGIMQKYIKACGKKSD